MIARRSLTGRVTRQSIRESEDRRSLRVARDSSTLFIVLWRRVFDEYRVYNESQKRGENRFLASRVCFHPSEVKRSQDCVKTRGEENGRNEVFVEEERSLAGLVGAARSTDDGWPTARSKTPKVKNKREKA